MTEEVTEKIVKLKLKMLHFAWDGEKDSELILKNLEQFKKSTDIDFRKLRVYVLTNFNTELEFDLYRIYKLKDLGYDPYVMIYDKEKAPKKLKKIARWTNNKFIFRTCEKFDDYAS